MLGLKDYIQKANEEFCKDIRAEIAEIEDKTHLERVRANKQRKE